MHMGRRRKAVSEGRVSNRKYLVEKQKPIQPSLSRGVEILKVSNASFCLNI